MAPTLYEKPEIGDLIEIFRGAYQHWAVYVGDGFVVHLAIPSEVPGTGTNSVISLLSDTAMVKKEKLEAVVATSPWKISNNLENEYMSHPARDIVREACARVGEELPYSVLTANCEHFANDLRYGKAESRQVREVKDAIKEVVNVVRGTIGDVLKTMAEGDKKENKNTQ